MAQLRRRTSTSMLIRRINAVLYRTTPLVWSMSVSASGFGVDEQWFCNARRAPAFTCLGVSHGPERLDASCSQEGKRFADPQAIHNPDRGLACSLWLVCRGAPSDPKRRRADAKNASSCYGSKGVPMTCAARPSTDSPRRRSSGCASHARQRRPSAGSTPHEAGSRARGSSRRRLPAASESAATPRCRTRDPDRSERPPSASTGRGDRDRTGYPHAQKDFGPDRNADESGGARRPLAAARSAGVCAGKADRWDHRAGYLRYPADPVRRPQQHPAGLSRRGDESRKQQRLRRPQQHVDNLGVACCRAHDFGGSGIR